MKEVNLISIVSAFRKQSPDLFSAYLDYHSIKMRTEELKDIEVLVDHLRSFNPDTNLFDKYFVGYSIPQISKEFDLIRIADDSIVNIELKANSTPEKITTQLVRNRYYLSFLNRKIFNYSYLTDSKKLYTIDKSQKLIEAKMGEVVVTLSSQSVKRVADIDSYFNPSNYLVSPFNSTNEFVSGKYFLTSQQEEIKRTVLDHLKLPGHSILGIKGRAGTGKTLLIYDIVKSISSQKALTVHCGLLNDGHNTLRDRHAWNIVPVKSLRQLDLSKYQLIVVDEAQRIFQNQLLGIIKEVKENSSKCIFSYDGQQTLKTEEIKNDLGEKIELELTAKPFELTTKIRTNKEVASFIQCLFNKERPLEKYKYSNIELNYFDNYQDAKRHLQQLKSEDWKIINYTPSNRSLLPYELYKIEEESDNAHKVIGQEFNNVVAVIDSHFYYKDGGSLSTKDYNERPFYHPTKMLFQIVSRTRLKLCVVIISNNEILSRCLDILKK